MKKEKNGLASSTNDFYTVITKIFPVLELVVVVGFFSVITDFKVVSAYNILALSQRLASTLLLCMGGLFVIAQGSIDMSLGVNVGLSGTIATMVANSVGVWAFFPVALLVGGAIGAFNGLVVSKGHSGSFLVTLSVNISLTAVMKLILGTGNLSASEAIKKIIEPQFMFPIVIAVIILIWYIFERTKVGYYIKAIGENELACRYAGIPVLKYKWLGFVICGMLAGAAGAFLLSRLGGSSYSTGTMQEMTAMIAIFLGGVLITGGMQSHLYKVIIGAIVIVVLENGMNLSGISSTWNEAIRGIVLIAVVCLTNFLNRKRNLKAGNKMNVTL